MDKVTDPISHCHKNELSHDYNYNCITQTTPTSNCVGHISRNTNGMIPTVMEPLLTIYLMKTQQRSLLTAHNQDVNITQLTDHRRRPAGHSVTQCDYVETLTLHTARLSYATETLAVQHMYTIQCTQHTYSLCTSNNCHKDLITQLLSPQMV